MHKAVSAFCLSLLSLFSCKGYKDLDVEQFDSALSTDTGIQLVDVRTPDEYAEGHLPLASNIDWKGEGFMEAASKELSKDRPVYVYCRSGRRSAAAAAALTRSGYEVKNMRGGYLAWTQAGKAVTQYEVERFLTDGGIPVAITLIKHGSLEIRYKGLSIQVDPVIAHGRRTDYAAEFPKADFILVTHEHPDHLDEAAIAALTGENTRLLLNQKSCGMIGRGEVIGNGETRILTDDIRLEAVPAYNTTPGREQFHPKGNDNGYVLTLDGLRIYIAGDTEDIPEMATLAGIDIAFLPVNQPYTMTPDQCIRAAQSFRPKVLIPYHYSQSDIRGIPAALPGMDVRIRQMQ